MHSVGVVHIDKGRQMAKGEGQKGKAKAKGKVKRRRANV